MSMADETSRLILLGFFLSHVPMTILLDGQASLVNFPYPQVLHDFTDWYAVTLKDPHFLGDYGLWFQCCITMELLLQLPYYFIAAYMFYKRACPTWFRVTSLIYAAQAMTVMVPILAVICFDNTQSANPSERAVLAGIYLPYLLVPAWLLYLLVKQDIRNARGASTASSFPVSIPGASKIAWLGFFVSHVPITVLIDSQALFPKSLYPAPLTNLVKWYTVTMGDHLMTAPHQIWFQSFVACECFLQFGFFFVAISQLRSKSNCAPWFPTAALVYGIHVCTTMIPIYAELIQTNQHRTSALQASMLCGIYSPYAIFPGWMAYWGAKTLVDAGNKEQHSTKRE